MYYIVYRIRNKIDKKIYVGVHQTMNINDSYMGSGKRIIRAIAKHGVENFDKKILFVFDNEVDMINMERKIVTEEFLERSDTYNIALGGWGGGIKSKEHRKNLSLSQKGKPRPKASEETKKKMSETRKKLPGNKWSDESKKRFSKLKTGVKTGPASEKRKLNIANALKGKPLPKTGQCVYCGKIMHPSHISRFHNEKCKEKP
jgi:hypothetical protein